MSDATAMQVMELAGRMIMEYGGETFRVEDTLTRMGSAMGIENVQCFAVPSGVFISFEREDGETETGLIRVKAKDTDLKRVDEVNRISRQMSEGKLTAEGAFESLKQVGAMPSRVTETLYIAACGVSAAAFAIMFGGGLMEFVVALVTGLLVQTFVYQINRRSLSGVPTTLLGSFLCAFLTMLFHQLTGLCDVDSTVAGELMPLLPGLAMTNAVQDMLRGDYVSGVSHAMRALVIAALVASGVLLAASLIRLIGGKL